MYFRYLVAVSYDDLFFNMDSKGLAHSVTADTGIENGILFGVPVV